MEINTEINRVFGTEMAKIFANTISEEEIAEKANLIWSKLNENRDNWGSRKEPEIEKYIREAILKRLYDKIEEILKEPIAEEALEKKAREMVEIARKVGEDAIIKDMAMHMADNVLSAYNSREIIVNDVLRAIKAMPENQRNY